MEETNKKYHLARGQIEKVLGMCSAPSIMPYVVGATICPYIAHHMWGKATLAQQEGNQQTSSLFQRICGMKVQGSLFPKWASMTRMFVAPRIEWKLFYLAPKVQFLIFS